MILMKLHFRVCRPSKCALTLSMFNSWSKQTQSQHQIKLLDKKKCYPPEFRLLMVERLLIVTLQLKKDFCVIESVSSIINKQKKCLCFRGTETKPWYYTFWIFKNVLVASAVNTLETVTLPQLLLALYLKCATF